jgi:hypothetical protein
MTKITIERKGMRDSEEGSWRDALSAFHTGRASSDKERRREHTDQVGVIRREFIV